MKIKLLHTSDCHVWQEAERQLATALGELNLPKEYEVILIGNEKQAKENHFLGSPQITIDGADIDPMTKNAHSFNAISCRPYFYKGKFYDYPPKEMIKEAIKVEN